MRPVIITTTLMLLLSMGAIAQQAGDLDRNYLVNGQGSGATSVVSSTVPYYLQAPGFVNHYHTQDALAPVAWVAATEAQIGWFSTATNSVDIGPAGLRVIADGSNPADPLGFVFKTNSAGDFGFTLGNTGPLVGASLYCAMLHFAATSPDGFWLSQTHHVSFDVNNLGSANFACSGGGTTIYAIGDDESWLVDIGFSFAFYGTFYTQCYIGSNGYLTFGAPDTDYSESGIDFLTGPPRIAGWWDDLDPSSIGTVKSYQSGGILNGSFRVCWVNVPEYGPLGANSFSITIKRSPTATIPIPGFDFDVYLDYAVLTSTDGLVGISPGVQPLGLPPIHLLNLSAAPNALSPGHACYELFDVNNPLDVIGKQVHIDLTDTGHPSLQN